jgi:hypothetical protein
MNTVKRSVLLVGALVTLARPVFPRSAQLPARLPIFEDFPVTQVFQGKPAAPILRGGDWDYRTRFREQTASGPDFAGHYKIVSWGCGSGCSVWSIVDERTGRIYHPFPFGVLNVPFMGTVSGRRYQGVRYQVDSSLLIVDGCPETKDVDDPRMDQCFTTYYTWQNQRLTLIKTIPAPQATGEPATR